MRRGCTKTLVRAALGCTLSAVWAAAAAEPAGESPPNQLSGVVVSKADGKPVAGVQVAMAHNEKGYIYFEEEGGLQSYGQDQRILGFFTKRNGKASCEAYTDHEGRFTFSNFMAAGEPWNLAAADKEHRLALLTRFLPSAYADKPLRIELDQPAYIKTQWPAAGTDEALQTHISLALAPPAKAPDAAATAEAAAGAEATAAAPAEESEPKISVSFSGISRAATLELAKGKDLRFGPLPGGFDYRVTLSLYGRSLPYSPTIFERGVSLAPGATETVSLESPGGAAISGRVLGTDGKPLAKVNVKVKAGGAASLIIGALTDDEGRYELKGVPPGDHKLELLRYAPRVLPG